MGDGVVTYIKNQWPVSLALSMLSLVAMLCGDEMSAQIFPLIMSAVLFCFVHDIVLLYDASTFVLVPLLFVDVLLMVILTTSPLKPYTVLA